MFGFGAFSLGSRAQRGYKAAATREDTKYAAAHWAADESRPFCLGDMVHSDKEKSKEAYAYFAKLSLADTKSECAMHGIPVSGAKKKLLEALFTKALTSQYGDKRGNTGAASATALGAGSAATVRRALVADLRKGLVWDKKLKKGANKMLKAAYANCDPALFQELFPHANGKAKCDVTCEHLQVDKIARGLRYGSSVALVPGSMKAKFENGTISISAKYSLF